MAVADQLALLFVPKTEGEGFEAGEEGDGFHGLEQRLRAMALLQIVIGDARAEVVDVVKADIPGEPL